MSFKKVLLLAGVIGLVTGLVGCNDPVKTGEDIEVFSYIDKKFVKLDEMDYITLYKTSNGNCYAKYGNYDRGSFSQVDCEDFWMGEKTLDQHKPLQ